MTSGPTQTGFDSPSSSQTPADRRNGCGQVQEAGEEPSPHSPILHAFAIMSSVQTFRCEGEGESMLKSSGHERTEILNADENRNGFGVVLLSRLEACRKYGQKRTITERDGKVSNEG